MHLTKIAPLATIALLAGSLAACGSDNSAAGGGGSGADCPLVNAADPGNSEGPIRSADRRLRPPS